MNIRIGQGIDVHAFADGRRLVLGGVEIPYEKGLAGHSDADVLSHAVCDALLGAAGLDDIGRHFPDTEARYKGADSLELLAQVMTLIAAQGWHVANLDATVIAQAPRLAPYVEQMRKNLGACLQIQADAVNIKATTTEFLGFTGRGEGVASIAVALLCKQGN